MENRENFSANSSKNSITPIEGIDRKASIIYPIIASGDVTGAVIMLASDDKTNNSTETDVKLVQTAASFLGKQMEE